MLGDNPFYKPSLDRLPLPRPVSHIPALFPLWLTALAWAVPVQAQSDPSAAVPPAPPLQSLNALQPPPKVDPQHPLPIVLRAREVRGRPDLETVADGDVEFRRAGVVIRADSMSYQQAEDLAQARGNVRISRDGNVYSGPEVQLHVDRFEGYFREPDYFFATIGAGGHASRIDFIDAQRSQATNATYTSCPVDGSGGPDWLLETSRVKIDLEANEGIAEDAVLRFLGVPILAAPVLSFPLTDARKSGWLPPSVNLDNKSGFELSVPYYWNIAPQRDATFTPAVYSRRGVGLGTEFRYLEPRDKGTWKADVLPDDRVAGRSRWALDVRHDGSAQEWDYRAAVKRVSDDAYWKDFSHGVDTLTPRLIPSDYALQRGFARSLGESTLYGRVQTWQVLRDADPAAAIVAPYQREPQLGVRWQTRETVGLEASVETEINRFSLPTGETDATRNTGWRAHALGSIGWAWRTPGWSLTPRLQVNTATYRTDLDMADGQARGGRTVPTFSIDSAWELEREGSWFGDSLSQTLEPRLLYVYTPYRDQHNFPLFDTAPKDFNFDSIYTPNEFSGIDRVSDAHQVTAGVTTRFVDAVTGAEKLRLGVVQRYRFKDQRVTTGQDETKPDTKNLSDLLLLGSTTLVPNWTLDASLQYSPDRQRMMRSIVGARWSPGPFRTIGGTYRLARATDGSVQSEQVELAWQWPLYGAKAGGRSGAGSSGCTGTWYGVGRVNFSTQDSRVTDSLVGFEYDAGCWIARIVAERQSTGRSEATNRLMLQLELVGLSRLGSNPLQRLKDNIPGYQLLRDERSPSARPVSYD